MSEWSNLFKKWLKRGDFVEVHPDVLQYALDEQRALLDRISKLEGQVEDESGLKMHAVQLWNEAENRNHKLETSEEAAVLRMNQAEDAMAKMIFGDEHLRKLEAVKEASIELQEVADLRGDNVLPHPENDVSFWTARMQEAWDVLQSTLADLENGSRL